ncbi:MAG: hypothetical protein KJ072_24265 [Verrucomicrobia bacterium]|nr:hypothetical protein [Verrucomicrobiota bacterium]
MNNHELDTLLRNSRPPDWPQAYWETFPSQVVRGVRESEPRTGRVRAPRRGASARLMVSGLAVAACLVLALWLGHRSPREGLDPQLVTASARLLSELTGLFPNTFRAVISEGNQSRILLSEGESARGTEPVLVRLCHNGECLTIVTFSGERIEVGPLRFEVLAGGKGEVLLVGEDFVWSGTDSAQLLQGQRVEAITFSATL